MGFASNGGGDWTKYARNTEFPLFPTEEHCNRLREIFEIELAYHAIKQTYHGEMGLTNVWSDIHFYEKGRIHPSQKPVALVERVLRIFTDENDLVLDPFFGSGTTGVACARTRRNHIGIEKSPEYYARALQPIQALREP